MAAQTAKRPAAVLHSEGKVRVKPINGFIGAEIEGIDLRHPLSDAQFAALALYILTKSGGNIDLSGEKHDVAGGHETAASAVAAPEAASAASAAAPASDGGWRRRS